MSVSTIKIYLNRALENIDSLYRVDQVEPDLLQAEQRLPNIAAEDAAPLIAQIADIRAKLENMVSPADARQLSAAQGKIRQARDFIETNHGNLNQSAKDHVEDLFQGAVQFLNQIADARKANKLKAPVLAEIDAIRAQYGTKGTPAPVYYPLPPFPPPAPKPTLSQNFSTAKNKVFWAKEYFNTPGRIDQTEPELTRAEELLQGDASHEADSLRAEIAALRDSLADIVMPSEEAYIRSAQRDVQSVRDYIDRQREFLDWGDTKLDLDRQLQRIIDEGLSKINHPRKADQLKAPILAEIALIRSQLNIVPPAPISQPPPGPAWAQALPQSWAQALPQSRPQVWPQSQIIPQVSPRADLNALSFDDQDRLNRARRSIGQARDNIESRRTEGVENLFFDATNILAPVSDAHKHHLITEIEQLRKELEDTRLAESTRIITGDLDRKLQSIEMDIEVPDRLRYSVISFKQRFDQEDVRRTLTSDAHRNYENRLASVLAAGNDHVKTEKLKRANPALQRLQDKLSTNPFTDLQQYEANRVDGELRSMKWQVEKEINELPEDDPDRLRIYEELKSTDAKFAAYSNEWAKSGIYDRVKQEWQMIRDEVQGWEQESLGPDTQILEDPETPMSRTRLAIQRVYYFLHRDVFVQRTRDENPGDFVIAAVDKEAEQLLEAVGNKLSSAYYDIIAAAEKIETPISDRWLQDKPGFLITNAQTTFENTKFCEPVLDRIRALDQRWKDELEALHQGRENLGEKLSVEAIQKWPSIVAAIPSIVSYFDPSSAKPGDAVHLKGVYNRAGWDFDGNQYGFSMRFNGVPLGGIYEPYINKALDHAAYQLKLAIDDHKEWDLVSIVLGPGSINQRTKRIIRRGMDTEEIEEWLPEGCLRLRIIALRAGPVVVGP
ncbi:hypothetical protein TWF506_010158 [Arthrobotrys conoides]|uniref:Uncharacterized protein n=1 Tax=Arthrobotrys conoides TaxID=74498 RepID=A0AAN8RQU6_9PEZI